MEIPTPSPLVELAWSVIISTLLLALGVIYFWREWSAWRRNAGYEQLPPEDRRHFQSQFFRRTVGCSLLIGSGLVILAVQGLLDWKQAPRLFAWLWTVVMVGLLAILGLAGADVVAIRRYARRHRRRLDADRRAMIDRQLELMREEHRSRRPFPPNLDIERN